MNNLKTFEQFINEGTSLIRRETGAFKLSDSQRKVLTSVFDKGIEGNENKVSDAQYFNSGYKGIVFVFKNEKYFLMFNPGKVGLEDQQVGSIYLKKSGSSDLIFKVGSDYFSRDFGDVGVKKNEIEEAGEKLKEFIETE